MKGNLTYRMGYFSDAKYRPMLNSLVGKIFGGLDFTPWVKFGFDFPEYTPFSFFDGDRVVANVSASPMNLCIAGEETRAIQIGTVATDSAYRGRGLVRVLMEKAEDHWDLRNRFSYLFADEDVATMYPRFGYRQVTEHAFQAPAPSCREFMAGARKLDLQKPEDLDLLYQLAQARSPVSLQMGVYRQSWLLMFHAAVAYPGQIQLIEPLNVIVICDSNGHTLRLVDVIGKEVPPLRELYPYLGKRGIDTIEFGFTPDRMDVDDVVVREPKDSLLFVRGNLQVETMPFRFPATSEA